MMKCAVCQREMKLAKGDAVVQYAYDPTRFTKVHNCTWWECDCGEYQQFTPVDDVRYHSALLAYHLEIDGMSGTYEGHGVSGGAFKVQLKSGYEWSETSYGLTSTVHSVTQLSELLACVASSVHYEEFNAAQLRYFASVLGMPTKTLEQLTGNNVINVRKFIHTKFNYRGDKIGTVPNVYSFEYVDGTWYHST